MGLMFESYDPDKEAAKMRQREKYDKLQIRVGYHCSSFGNGRNLTDEQVSFLSDAKDEINLLEREDLILNGPRSKKST